MSSNTPTSFASAAAGQARGSRSGDGDWHRRDGRSANGTMTFRRSSATPASQHYPSAPDSLPAALPSVAETQPAQHLPPFDGSSRYSRDQMLSIYRGTSAESFDVATLLSNGWSSTQANGSPRGWGKNSEGTVPQDPTVCWDTTGYLKPVGLQDLTPAEKEIFSDVNSTLKPQQPKDSSQGGGAVSSNTSANGRKISVSHGSGYNAQSTSSISAPRSAARRREAPDTVSFPSGTGSGGGGGGVVSPLSNRTARDESWFGRRNADAKEQQPPEESGEESITRTPNLGAVGRGNGPSSSNGLGASSSLWGTPAVASGATSGPNIGSAMGAFGNFSLPATIGEKRFGSTRGESRLAHLIPKQDVSDTPGSSAKQTSNAVAGASAKESWRPRARTDTDPFAENSGTAHSSVVGGGHQQDSHVVDTPVKGSGGNFGMSDFHSGASVDNDALASPETNPFGSPPADRAIDEENLQGAFASSRAGMVAGSGGTAVGSEHVATFGSLRGYPANAFDGSDRSQTSSVGAKGFSGLTNIAAGWGNPMAVSTPDRERNAYVGAFGSSLFSPVAGELQSPGFGGIVPGGGPGGVFGPPSMGGASGSLRAGTSKLGSLFPASLQTQMASGQEQEGGALGDSVPDLRQINPLGAIGREAVGFQTREPDMGGLRSTRALFEDLVDSGAAPVGTGSAFTTEQQPQSGILASSSSPLPQGQVFDSGLRPSTDTPPNAPRTMVMPDRMRWVYLDPQGQTQGPFTGLEMNDWYKANFFTPDLRVKRVEDAEFEPLGQLIRRIGNSREPFLVPQMGIAHGQPSLSGTFAHGDRGTVIPPLVGAFPSYGRTLTAEEQNNLERRKQEEQYMLARQRELMAVQHHPFPAGRVPGAPGAPGAALHHHSSVHSLHSQPSYGSITSPLATAPPPMLGGLGTTPGFFDHAALSSATQPQASSSTDFLRDDINLQDRQLLSDLQQASDGAANAFSQQPSTLPYESSSLSHLPAVDQLQKDSQGFSERLKEFKQLRSQMDANDYPSLGIDPSVATASGMGFADVHGQHHQAVAEAMGELALEEHSQESKKVSSNGGEPSSPLPSLSLTQQVQNTQAAVAAAQWRAGHPDDASEATQTDLPMPFPPPPSDHLTTPLAAPTAQRTRSTLPDQYATSRSQSETPESAAASSSTQLPQRAPWAREVGTESHRGPSLKEIQEAEAKKAAKAEEAAAAARRAAAEHEAVLLRERERANAVLAPGLPTTSTWGSSGTPAASVPSSSPWAKASTTKAGISGSSSGNSLSAAEKTKTLDEIQREEEARKQRALASQGLPASIKSGGKLYADRVQQAAAASSISTALPSLTASIPASGWSTVGAGGKVKTPAGAATGRPVSSATPVAKPGTALQPGARSVSRLHAGPADKASGGVAMDEFNKWLHRELSRGVSEGLDVKTITETLLELPMEQLLISEVVYSSSKTMDGNHFAEEFIRRKKLADKGVVEKQSGILAPADNKVGGGWSEVAKKGSSGSQHKEDNLSAGFKVVPGRKKGKK